MLQVRINSWGESGVADYQLFLFGADGRRWRSVLLPCKDDEEAVRIAADRGGRRLMEIWRGARLVGHFPKTKPQPQ